ncbi:hypothetical protein XENTR_v10019498 [Xenopus tropicalis]|uniref:Phospholipase A2 inhibitor and Ly6/PLAUR domain-containing protein n=1 Tax=Xenopus tropicalis TaxID=8364 RepID=A0A8J0SRL8_XENTR|nr:phospholipase A2 inhibitor and Ly6/PLAUR domain-containing protein [Xenopus tropicalis]KAE8594214.1 hypothetical protein XENTR_v10019498 [Xenopus tropicalis]
MEKAILLACVLAVLIPTGLCLSCYECKMNEQYKCVGAFKVCAKNEICLSAYAKTEMTSSLIVGLRKCAPAKLCDQSYSLSSNGKKMTLSTSCCKTNKCQPSPKVKDNEIKCPFCTADDSGSCSGDQTLQCTGPEDKCFSFFSSGSSGQPTARGCVTSNICSSNLKNTIVPQSYQNGKIVCKDPESDQTGDGDQSNGDNSS